MFGAMKSGVVLRSSSLCHVRDAKVRYSAEK